MPIDRMVRQVPSMIRPRRRRLANNRRKSTEARTRGPQRRAQRIGLPLVTA